MPRIELSVGRACKLATGTCCVECRGQLVLIESRSLGAGGCINEHERNAIGAGIAIPEAAVVDPLRILDRVVDKRVEVVVHQPLGPCVIGCGIDLAGLRCADPTPTAHGHECRVAHTSKNHLASTSPMTALSGSLAIRSQ